VNLRVVPVWGIAAAFAVGLALDATYLALDLSTGQGIPAGVEQVTLAAAYIVSGTLAWRRNAQYWTGPVLVLVGYLVLISALVRFPNVGALYAIGSAYGGIHEAVLGYLLLTYPPDERAAVSWVGWHGASLPSASALPRSTS
jgi:hypothetical protein